MVIIIMVATTTETAVIKITNEEVSLLNLAKTQRNSISLMFYRAPDTESYFYMVLWCKCATLVIKTLGHMFFV